MLFADVDTVKETLADDLTGAKILVEATCEKVSPVLDSACLVITDGTRLKVPSSDLVRDILYPCACRFKAS